MTRERTDAPTPGGGDYSIAVFVDGATMNEVDKAVADTIIISEYLTDGTFVRETVGTWTPSKDAAETETDEELFARLGFEVDDSTDTTVLFLGPKAAPVAKKTFDRKP